MIFIDLFGNPPPKDLIDEGTKLTEELKALPPNERSAFIDKHKDYWGKLKDHYAALSHKKCWYTEARDVASHKHMDHFRPKKKTVRLQKNCKIKTSNNSDSYWWLAFDWENYRYSCGVPNNIKGNYFPLKYGTQAAPPFGNLLLEEVGLLDPTKEDDVRLLTFDPDGMACAVCKDKKIWDNQRVELSIRVYNLNNVELVNERIEIQNKCRLQIKRVTRACQSYLRDQTEDNKEILLEEVRELKKMAIPKAEFSAVAKTYIQNYPDEFIRKIVG